MKKEKKTKKPKSQRKTLNIQFQVNGKKIPKPVYLDLVLYERLKEKARLDRRPVHGYVIAALQKRVDTLETGEELYRLVEDDFTFSEHRSWNKYFLGLIQSLVDVEE